MGVCVALLQENLTGKVCQPWGLVQGWLSMSVLSGMGMWDLHGGLSRYLKETSFYDSLARMRSISVFILLVFWVVVKFQEFTLSTQAGVAVAPSQRGSRGECRML